MSDNNQLNDDHFSDSYVNKRQYTVLETTVTTCWCGGTRRRKKVKTDSGINIITTCSKCKRNRKKIH